ncbi:MAG TPA: VWA domain-containing protein [Terriglobales bacterium]|nr:VWA domain-containing protein [Terriglobales bacterium]
MFSFRAAVVLAAIAVGSNGALFAQQRSSDTGVFRVKSQLVMVDAQVVNKKTGRAVRNLKQDDFQLLEDGLPQPITAFSQDEQPLSVVLLFDLTDSVRPVLKALAAGALEALQHLKPEDRVCVMAYSASVQMVQDFTTDRELAARAVETAGEMKSDEAAFFNEGIYQAADWLARYSAPASRHVIIWFTDDVPNFPSDDVRARYGQSLGKAALHTEKEAREELLRTDVSVYTLLEQSEISEEQAASRQSNLFATKVAAMQNPPGDVHKYAKISGGSVVEADRKHAPERLAKVIDDIRMRYSLAYHPPGAKPAGKFCTIKVKVSREAGKDLLVQAKQGYYR